MSDIHIYIEREQPVRVITLEPSGKRGPAGATGPAGPNSVTSATTSDGTAEIKFAIIQVGDDQRGLEICNQGGDIIGVLGKNFSQVPGSSSYSFSFGENSSSENTHSYAIGESCRATSNGSFAMGLLAKSLHQGAFVFNDASPDELESTQDNEFSSHFTNGYRFLGGTASFTAVVAPQEVKSANFTAVNGGGYIAVATLTVTDPTPSEGASFSVLVRNGTATVGGTAYAVAGSLIRRVFHSGSWQNYEYKNHAQYGNLATVNGGTGVATALAVNTGSAGAFVVNGGTATNMVFAGSAAFDSTTRPTSAGTGTPAATSLITLTDADTRFGGPIYTSFLANNTSYTNDATGTTILSVTLPAGTYQVEVFVRFSANAANSKTVTGTSVGSTDTFSGWRETYNNGTAPSRVAGANQSPSGGGPWGATANVDNHGRYGTLRALFSTTYSIIASQNTTSATTTTVAAGSYLIARKIA
jgi:hypothetical protein